MNLQSYVERRNAVHAEIREMGLTTSEAIIKAAEIDPDLFRRFYPKVYEGVDDYTSPKLIAALLLDIAVTVRVLDTPSGLPTAYAVTYRPVCDMVAHRIPMYFVTRDLVAAAMKTDYKDEIDFLDIHLPFEAGIFVLPRNTLVHPEHGDCSFIGWGRTQSLKEYEIPGFSIRPYLSQHSGMVFFTAAYKDEHVPWLHFNLVDKPGTPRRFKIPEIVPSAPHLKRNTSLDAEMATSDDDFINRMSKLAFNLFMIKEARPQLLKNGTLRKRVVKKDRTVEFWSPHILGHEYKIRRVRQSDLQPGVIEMGQRRSYWVNGHGKQQAYGPKFSLRKPIWIDPYWVDTGIEE